MSEDRRKFRRLRYGVIVEVSYFKPGAKDEEIFNKLHTKDISGGGIRITVPTELEIGALVSVKLTMPYTKKEIECFGQVAWVTPAKDGEFETGLMFMNLSNRETAVIISFIENELEKGIE